MSLSLLVKQEGSFKYKITLLWPLIIDTNFFDLRVLNECNSFKEGVFVEMNTSFQCNDLQNVQFVIIRNCPFLLRELNKVVDSLITHISQLLLNTLMKIGLFFCDCLCVDSFLLSTVQYLLSIYMFHFNDIKCKSKKKMSFRILRKYSKIILQIIINIWAKNMVYLLISSYLL